MEIVEVFEVNVRDKNVRIGIKEDAIRTVKCLSSTERPYTKYEATGYALEPTECVDGNEDSWLISGRPRDEYSLLWLSSSKGFETEEFWAKPMVELTRKAVPPVYVLLEDRRYADSERNMEEVPYVRVCASKEIAQNLLFESVIEILDQREIKYQRDGKTINIYDEDWWHGSVIDIDKGRVVFEKADDSESYYLDEIKEVAKVPDMDITIAKIREIMGEDWMPPDDIGGEDDAED